MIDEKFVILAVLLNIYGDAKYLIATLKGEIKPDKISWLFWALAPLVAFPAELAKGVGWASLMTLSIGLNPLMVFFASFVNKKAQWKIKRLDIICGALSLLGIILWFISREANIAIFFALFADFTAGIPTLVKSWKNPETENVYPFACATIAGFITLLTLKSWDFATSAFPVYLLIIGGVFVLFIKFRIGKRLTGSV